MMRAGGLPYPTIRTRSHLNEPGTKPDTRYRIALDDIASGRGLTLDPYRIRHSRQSRNPRVAENVARADALPFTQTWHETRRQNQRTKMFRPYMCWVHIRAEG